MAVTVIEVHDFLTDSADVAVANAQITLTFGYNQATTADGLVQPGVRTTTTDSTGKWTFAKVIPTDLISPNNTVYLVTTPFRSYEIAPLSTNGTSQQSTAANVIVNNPLGLAPYTGLTSLSVTGPVTITGNETVSGTLGVTGASTLGVVTASGLVTANAGEVIAGGTGATLNASGDLAVRSVTVSSGSGPYTPLPSILAGSFMNTVYAKIVGDGVTDEGPAINTAITAANAAGGGTVIVPGPSTGGVLAFATTIVPKSNVSLRGPGMGVKLKWTGATTTSMVANPDPGAGNNLLAFSMSDFQLDANNTSNVNGVYLISWQNGWMRNMWIRGLTGAAPTAGLRLEALSGTGAPNNTAFNHLSCITIDQAPIGIRLAGKTGGGPGVTDNWFYSTLMHGIATTGISYVQFCDTNQFQDCLIQATGSAFNSGIVLNDSATPNADVGVYNERHFGLSIDLQGTTGGPYWPITCNWSKESVFELYVSGTSQAVSATNPINDTNAAANAQSYECIYFTAANNKIAHLSKGMDFNLANTGSNPDTFALGNLGGDSAPTNTGFVRILGSGGGGVDSFAGGLEFQASKFGSGYGWRILNPDLGGSGQPLIFMTRQNATAWTDAFRLDNAGHLMSSITGTPTTTALGANITSVTFTGNDVRGKIVIVVAAGGLAANTKICTVTFASAYISAIPIPMLVNETSFGGAANLNFYSLNEALGSWDLFCNFALVAGVTYTLRYVIIG